MLLFVVLSALFIVVIFLLYPSLSKRAQKKHSELNLLLLEISNKIQNLSSSGSYIKESYRNYLLQRIKRELSGISIIFWTLFVRRKYKAEHRRVLEFNKNSEGIVESLNNRFIDEELKKHKDFFDRIESNPLTHPQRRACVIDQDHNLVIAGAGSGKTSTMIGRAGYLIESGRANSYEILMLAFARKAANEMQDRISDKLKASLKTVELPKASTFHALGLHIISQVEGKKPDLSKFVEQEIQFQQFIDQAIVFLSADKNFSKKLIKFQLYHRFTCRLPEEFKSIKEYSQYIQENKLQTMRGEFVKSYEEIMIANFLYSSSINYEYERRYEHPTADIEFEQYCPDFYLTDYGIYIEHFALNRRGEAPEYFNKNVTHTYEEGVEWKRKIHKEHRTTLIETYSYLQKQGKLLFYLKNKLLNFGVEIKPKTNQELLKEINENQYASEFSKLAKRFIQLKKQTIFSFPDLYQKAQKYPDYPRLRDLLFLMNPICDYYEQYLKDNHEIDFSDMIRKATDYISTGRFKVNLKHILVDEFQDISPARAGLIKSIIDQDPSISLFAVGDDWQSIYRFTGSDLNMMINFSDEFGHTTKTVLDTTFRFNNQIGKCSSAFVLQNSKQIKKTLQTYKKSDQPEISIVTTRSNLTGLKLSIEAIGRRDEEEAKIFVLARTHHLIKEVRFSGIIKLLQKQFTNVSIDFMTIHASKGKEADYVILIGLLSDELPAEKPVDDILELLLPEKERYPFAEERRLFYVALTRAKNRVYLVYNPDDPSPFMTEIYSGKYDICDDEIITGKFPPNQPKIQCPTCHRGQLILKKGVNGYFFGCSKYPMCRHTENLCPSCGSGILEKKAEVRQCASCDTVIPICPQCGGNLLIRNGKYGKFLGCSNYRHEKEIFCKYTRKMKASSK